MARKRPKRWRSPEEFLDWLENWNKLPKLARIIRPMLISGISLLIVIVLYMNIYSYINTLMYVPVDPNDKTVAVFEIKRGESLSTVARRLAEQNFIRNKWVFKLNADFTNNSDKIQAGIYKISRSMTNNEILNIFIQGVQQPDIVRVTLVEGSTIQGMIERLEKAGLVKDKENMIKILETGDGYKDREILASVKDIDKRIYFMEGYLFPDTYEFYVSASDEEVINRLLNRFEDIFDDEMRERADALGMSIDEVVTMASIIEKEAKTADFAKVSAVLHNRLDKNMLLQVDSTIKYITKSTKIVVSTEEKNSNTPYNTYKYTGLPPGPICNPSKNAILAALYPDEDYIDRYYYFCTADPVEGTLVFAMTLEEHQQNVAKYSPIWEEYDQTYNQG